MKKTKRPDPWDVEACLDYDLPWEESSPEEYAATNWLDYHVFTPENWDIKNERLREWVLRLGEILNSLSLLNECRKKYLSEEETKNQDKRLKEM